MLFATKHSQALNLIKSDSVCARVSFFVECFHLVLDVLYVRVQFRHTKISPIFCESVPYCQ